MDARIDWSEHGQAADEHHPRHAGSACGIHQGSSAGDGDGGVIAAVAARAGVVDSGSQVKAPVRAAACGGERVAITQIADRDVDGSWPDKTGIAPGEHADAVTFIE